MLSDTSGGGGGRTQCRGSLTVTCWSDLHHMRWFKECVADGSADDMTLQAHLHDDFDESTADNDEIHDVPSKVLRFQEELLTSTSRRGGRLVLVSRTEV